MLLPRLEEFKMDRVPFPCVDPSTLPANVASAFDRFMAGQSVPHRIFVYAHDYHEFCLLVERGDIKIE